MHVSKSSVLQSPVTESTPPGENDLRELYGEPRDIVREAWAPRLDGASRHWVSAASLLLISSINEDGDTDITPRGGEPGFIHIRDDENIAILDEKGNNKIHTLRNLVSNHTVGMMFVIPGVGDVLRAYGTAKVSTSEELIHSLGGSSDKNRSVITIRLHRVFPHCSKAFARAGMWNNERWVDTKEFGVPGLIELAKKMAATRLEKD
jgi:PPOX class probable FMN-dependent enzyme